MHFRYLLLLIFLFQGFENSFSQTFEVSGKIFDAKTNKALEYVTVRLADTAVGTTADMKGFYFMKLAPGSYKIIFSFIGYYSDTTYIFVEDKSIERNIYLKQSEILTDQINVYGEDPAYEIIRKAIEYKRVFKASLNEYEYDAYSKFVIRSNQSDITEKDLAEKVEGTTKIPIFGILESETKGYFKKPDLEKQIVTANRETANIARGFAIPFIVNFYDENLDFNEFRIPTPLSDNAFDNYEYKLKGTTSIDSLLVYKIDVINSSENRPLLAGTIYIADSIYSLMNVNLTTNDAAKPLGINKINFKQSFSPFRDVNKTENIYWMPTDVRIFAEGSFAAIIKFHAEVFTIVSHYDLNKKAPKGIFDEFVVKVMPDAHKDSAYWDQNQLIKSTKEEKNAFKIIEDKTREKEHSLSFGLTELKYGKSFYSNTIDYYHYNRVEGSAVGFNLNYTGKLRRLQFKGDFIYGTSDKKSKFSLSYRQRFFNDRRLSVNAGIYKKLEPLSFPVLLGISQFYNTFTALMNKQDNLDYYYAAGYTLGFNYKIIPQFGIGMNYTQESQKTAYKNTNYSFRKKDVEFNLNPEINDAYQRVFGIEFRIDPNNYRAIDWGDGDVSRFKYSNLPVLDAGFGFSGIGIFSSTYNYRTFSASISGQNYFNRFINLKYSIGGKYMNGDVPFQSLAYFNSNTGTIDIGLGFNAMNYQEFLGDRLYFINISNNFGKLLWGGIPFISKWNLIGFFNAGRNEISNSNYELAAYKSFRISSGIYMEAGFGISRILDLLRIDFAWRLNNLYNNENKTFINISLDSF